MRIVTGCSRSGSSFICQLLHQLGADFGSDNELIQADKWNKKGYFENKSVNTVNHQLLFGPWSSPRLWIETMWPPNPLIRLRKLSTLAIAPLISQQRLICKRGKKRSGTIKTLSSDLEDKIIKDPRFCYLMSPWKRYGKIDSVLFVLRHPWESASSMSRQTGLPLKLTYVGWKDSILSFWKHDQGLPVHLVDYNSFFNKTDPAQAMKPLFKFIGRRFVQGEAESVLGSTLDLKMRSHKAPESDLPRSINKLYQDLLNRLEKQ